MCFAADDVAQLALRRLETHALLVARKSAEATMEYAEAELRRMSRSHRGFQLLAKEEFYSGVVQGLRLSFRSTGPDGALHHELVYMPLSTVLMVLVVNGHVAHAEACTETLRQAVESIQLR